MWPLSSSRANIHTFSESVLQSAIKIRIRKLNFASECSLAGRLIHVSGTIRNYMTTFPLHVNTVVANNCRGTATG